jgi:RimJ/RimL family protein N-acetyltransferase
MELSDGWIRLRAYRPDDVDALFEAVSESVLELAAWLPWAHPGYCRDESAAWVASRAEAWYKGDAYDFAIEDARTSALLCGCGLNRIDVNSKCANLGYWVRTSRAGRGVATAAVRLLVPFGLADLGLQRLEILVAAQNRASQRVAEKAGARKEGILRKRFFLQGLPQDAMLYSLIAEDLSQS